MNMRWLHLIPISVSLAALAAVSPTAAAQPEQSQRPVEEESEVATTKLVPRPSGNAEDGTVTTAAISPSGCEGYSNNPHKSTSPDTYGDIKGNAGTKCVTTVPVIEIKATVWRKRWWGYEQMGEAGLGTETWYSRINRSGHWDGCQNNSWRTVGNHHVLDRDGVHYYAETMRYADVTNC